MIARTLCLLALLLLPGPARAGQIVRVGGYEFAPFVEIGPDLRPTGLAPDLLELLNRVQSTYQFQLVATSPSRRYQDFEAGRWDVIFFESLDWGWRDKRLPVEATEVFLTGGEVYIAAAQPGRSQAFFQDLDNRRMVGIRGYHYGFANFNADPDFLERRFRMLLVNDNEASIEMILRQRGEVAVVTDSYLSRTFLRRPELRQQLLVSDRLDQVYRHTALARTGAVPGAARLDQLIQGLARDGALARLWASYGIGPGQGAER